MVTNNELVAQLCDPSVVGFIAACPVDECGERCWALVEAKPKVAETIKQRLDRLLLQGWNAKQPKP